MVYTDEFLRTHCAVGKKGSNNQGINFEELVALKGKHSRQVCSTCTSHSRKTCSTCTTHTRQTCSTCTSHSRQTWQFGHFLGLSFFSEGPVFCSELNRLLYSDATKMKNNIWSRLKLYMEVIITNTSTHILISPFLFSSSQCYVICIHNWLPWRPLFNSFGSWRGLEWSC